MGSFFIEDSERNSQSFKVKPFRILGRFKLENTKVHCFFFANNYSWRLRRGDGGAAVLISPVVLLLSLCQFVIKLFREKTQPLFLLSSRTNGNNFLFKFNSFSLFLKDRRCTNRESSIHMPRAPIFACCKIPLLYTFLNQQSFLFFRFSKKSLVKLQNVAEGQLFSLHTNEATLSKCL